jgi:hypothetical protein
MFEIMHASVGTSAPRPCAACCAQRLQQRRRQQPPFTQAGQALQHWARQGKRQRHLHPVLVARALDAHQQQVCMRLYRVMECCFSFYI